MSPAETPSAAIDNSLIRELAREVIRLKRALTRYAYHAGDCAANEGYPCTCGLDRVSA